MDIIIFCGKKRLQCGALSLPIRIGKAGFIRAKHGREGDAKTPLGDYHLRWGFYRADRLPAPRSKLTFRALQKEDGWCDAPQDPAYNRFIKLPCDVSHEALWREDGAYDIVLVISHNDSPPIAGRGSAVFIHAAQWDDRETLGCVALSPNDMAALLPKLYAGQSVQILA